MIDKYLSPFTKITKSIVTASLFYSLCWLVGNCWALGYQSFGYISITDIMKTSLRISPLFGLMLIAFFWCAFFLKKVPPEEERTIKKYNLIVSTYVTIIMSITFIYCNLKIIYFSLLWSSGILFVWSSFYLRFKIEENEISEENAFVLMCGILGLFLFLASFATNAINVIDKNFKYEEEICINNECWNGRTIQRFSDATYFQQEEDGSLITIMNSEISEIKSIKQ
ncbi:hypothetical protein FB480_101643 [Agrobacterium vitis]|nr:hypothetical protein FB480_101643 [Agrobacterium vitis]